MGSESKKSAKKQQRIRMRLYQHPVKLDGTIVEFDGPYPLTKFWRYSETLVSNKPPVKNTYGIGCVPAEGSQLWEVL